MLIKYFEDPSNDQAKLTNVAKFLSTGYAMFIASQAGYQIMITHGKEVPDNSSILKALAELEDLLEMTKTNAESLLNLVRMNQEVLSNNVVTINQ